MEKNQYQKHDEKWKLNFGFSSGTKEEIVKRLADWMQNLTAHLQGQLPPATAMNAELEFRSQGSTPSGFQ